MRKSLGGKKCPICQRRAENFFLSSHGYNPCESHAHYLILREDSPTQIYCPCSSRYIFSTFFGLTSGSFFLYTIGKNPPQPWGLFRAPRFTLQGRGNANKEHLNSTHTGWECYKRSLVEILSRARNWKTKFQSRNTSSSNFLSQDSELRSKMRG